MEDALGGISVAVRLEAPGAVGGVECRFVGRGREVD